MYTLRYDDGIKLDAKGDNLKFENGSLEIEGETDSTVQSLQALNEQIYEKMIANVSFYGVADKMGRSRTQASCSGPVQGGLVTRHLALL